jgi:hypothetical protein
VSLRAAGAEQTEGPCWAGAYICVCPHATDTIISTIMACQSGEVSSPVSPVFPPSTK